MSAPATGPEAQFFAFLAEGRFMLQRFKATGGFTFPPRVAVAGAEHDGYEWVEASGAGEVYSTTVIRRKPEHGGDFNMALVQLAEGPRLLTRVVGVPPEAVRIGMAVRARIEMPAWDPAATAPVVVFHPA